MSVLEKVGVVGSEIVTCPSGLVNDPSAFINWVDIDCVPYTKVQFGVFAVGCLMWVVAYVIMLMNARKYKYIEMAAVAAASNLAWEILWSTVYSTDMGWFLSWTYRAWLIVDVFIFWNLLKYGHKQFTNPLIVKYFKPIALTVVVFFVGVYYTLGSSGYETSIGSVSAYICQFIISILCLALVIRAKNLRGFSWHIAWLRSFGTALVSVFMFLHYPDNHFVHWLCIWSFACDCTYMLVFRGMKKQELSIA
jgi:hypothetical protein